MKTAEAIVKRLRREVKQLQKEIAQADTDIEYSAQEDYFEGVRASQEDKRRLLKLK